MISGSNRELNGLNKQNGYGRMPIFPVDTWKRLW